MAGHTDEDVEARPEEELDPVVPDYSPSFPFTQYGVRMPDGTELWAPLTVTVLGGTLDATPVQTTREGMPFHGIDLARLEDERVKGTPGPYTEDFRSALWSLAGSVYLEPEDYAAGVSVIHREVTVSVGPVQLRVPSSEHLRALE